MTLIAYITMILASVIITLTMLARANDQRVRKGLRWHLRLLGFVLTGVGTPATVYTTIFSPLFVLPFLTIQMTGVALVFLTTPNQIPWHQWLWNGGGDVI